MKPLKETKDTRRAMKELAKLIAYTADHMKIDTPEKADAVEDYSKEVLSATMKLVARLNWLEKRKEK